MSDHHATPFLSVDECVRLGLEPYAVYGGKVYSYIDTFGSVIPHGSPVYGAAVERVRLEAVGAG